MSTAASAQGNCIKIKKPGSGATVSGPGVAIQTIDGCEGAWFEMIAVDGIQVGAFPPGQVSFDTSSVANGRHLITVTSQSQTPNSVVLGSASVKLRVHNRPTPTPTPQPTPTPPPPSTPTPTATVIPPTPTPTSAPTASPACISITSPANNSTVGGNSVAINTNDTCSGLWFEALQIDGVSSGAYAPGQVLFDSTTVTNGNHNIKVTSQSINPNSVVLGSSSVNVNVQNNGAVGTPTSTPTSQPASPTATPTATPASASPTATPTASAGHYSMLPPGAALPDVSSCISAVNASPIAENAPWNQDDGTGFNSNQPPPGGVPSYFYQNAPCCGEMPNADFQKVDGNYTGTTDDIIRVYACKWGIDEDYVRAQALIESHWHQDCPAAHGAANTCDFSTKSSANACLVCREGGDYDSPAGCALGVASGLPITPISPDGAMCEFQGYGGSPAGNGWTSWSMLQTKVYYMWMTWPMIAESTPFGVDYRYAEMRGCVNGDQFSYYNSQSSSSGTDYQNAVNAAKSDPEGASRISGWTNLQYLAYGCVDTHFSGDWFSGSADSYLNEFLSTLNSASWPGGNK